MIFPGFQGCPLCEFDVALGSSYGFPECFGEASGAQEVSLEAPRGAREERQQIQQVCLRKGSPNRLKQHLTGFVDPSSCRSWDLNIHISKVLSMLSLRV